MVSLGGRKMVRPSAGYIVLVLAFVLKPSQTTAADAPVDVASLVAQLHDNDALVRLKAAKLLGDFGPKAADALPALENAARGDADEDVRAVAERAAEKVSGAAHRMKLIPALEKLVNEAKAGPLEKRQKAMEDLAAMGNKANDTGAALVELMMDKSPEIQKSAADAIEKIDPDIWRPLVESIMHHNRTACAQVGDLGLKGRNALPALLRFYKEETDPVAKSQNTDVAAIAGQFLVAAAAVAPADERVISIVRHIVTTKTPSITDRNLLTTALELISPPIPPDAERLRNRELSNVRVQLPKAEAVKLLMLAVGSPDDKNLANAFNERALIKKKCRMQAIRALGEYGPGANDALNLLKSFKYDRDAMDEARKAIEAIEGH
jgi:hypothetical protein